jgi:hypothetical protein
VARSRGWGSELFRGSLSGTTAKVVGCGEGISFAGLGAKYIQAVIKINVTKKATNNLFSIF